MQINRRALTEEMRRWLKRIIIYIGVALFLRYFIFNLSIVSTGSMSPAIQAHDKIIVAKFSYWFYPVKRGDIVVFRSPDEKNVQLVKRVVGLGGETVLIKDGQLYIDGELYMEDYIYEQMNENFGPYTVPSDGMFVMGDNRNNSDDCRKWENKYITRKMIIGKAYAKFGSLK